ncbi:MAG TPA: hypothetical protein DIT64_19160 [Verrucomicrobiales bacterium]|nr:hypothetical protein [Verrucomicrobiales bacterium]
MKNHPASFARLETLEARLAPAGIVALNLSGSLLTITGDAFGNEIGISEAGGMWTVEALPGSATEFSLNRGPLLSSVTFAAPASIRANLGAGDDVLLLSGLTMSGYLTVNAGDGSDTLDLTSTFINGAVTAGMGNGDDVFTAGGDLFFGRGLNVNLGAGADTFELNATSLLANAAITAKGAGTPVDLQSFTLAAADGLVKGAVTLSATGNAPADFIIGDLPDDLLTVTGALNLSAGAGEDHVFLSGTLDIAGMLNIRLGNGVNLVRSDDLGDLFARGLFYGGGSGTDELILLGRDIDLATTLTFNGGAGTNRLELDQTGFTTIGGALTYNGGAGVDVLLIGGADTLVGGLVAMNAGAGENAFGLNSVLASVGSVRFTGGAGNDVVDIGENTGASDLVTVRGAVNVNTGAGSADVLVRDADIHGALNITTNSPFGGIDLVRILDSDVRGAMMTRMNGGADSDVIVRDSIFDRNATIHTGNGDDLVEFDTDTDVSSIFSVFHGYVRVYLGAGNDIFLAGSNPAVNTVGNDFRGYVDVHGGAGYDRVYFMDPAYNNIFPGGEPLAFTVEEVY